MTGYEWPEAARNDKAFGERTVDYKECSHRERKTIEVRLMGLTLLWNSGMESTYISDNIKFYSEKYHEITGSWYHQACSLQKTITGGKE